MSKLNFRKRYIIIMLILTVFAFVGTQCVTRPREEVPAIAPDILFERYGSESSRFLPLKNQIKIHYRDEGCTTCPVIVMIHGAWSSLHAWEGWVEQLGEDFRLISFDLPAHGLTGPITMPRYEAGEAVKLFEEIRKKLNLEHFTIAGNSLGGQIAWRYALDNPERVSALILVDSAGAPTRLDRRLEFALSAVKLPLIWRLIPTSTPTRDMVENGANMTYSRAEARAPERVTRTWELMRYPGATKAFNQGFRQWKLHDPRAEELSNLQTPTLILWGEQDRLMPLKAGAWFHATIPNSKFISWSDVGHAPMEEIPQESAAEVMAFLSAHDKQDKRSDLTEG